MFISFISNKFDINITIMNQTIEVKKPTKKEQQTAMESYKALSAAIEQLTSKEPEIEVEETKEHIKIPIKALKILGEILKAMSEGQPISIVPLATEVTTQKAAEMLGCSRPFLVNLLETGEIPFYRVGKHRRIKMEDVIKYKKKIKEKQRKRIIEIMHQDEDSGLYDI